MGGSGIWKSRHKNSSKVPSKGILKKIAKTKTKTFY
jgi:hypothetical protein